MNGHRLFVQSNLYTLALQTPLHTLKWGGGGIPVIMFLPLEFSTVTHLLNAITIAKWHLSHWLQTIAPATNSIHQVLLQ